MASQRHIFRTAQEVIEVLQTPQALAGSASALLRKQASIDALLEAASTTTSDTEREQICYVLGLRKSKRALGILIRFLDSESVNLRSTAADSLAKIGDPKAGPALLEHYLNETALPVKRMYAIALGAVNSHEAIPFLLRDLTSHDASLRGSIAWSLGRVGDTKVAARLQQALLQEPAGYARERIQEAVRLLSA